MAWTTRLFLFALGLAGSGLGCAATALVEPFYVARPAGHEDRLQNHRYVLREARAHPLASEVGRELDLAETWIERADRLVVVDDDARLELYLEAIEGQLVLVRTHYARREAERELEALRAGYEARAQRMKADEATLARPTRQGEETP